jgi:SAM-dependent methyltransferase
MTDRTDLSNTFSVSQDWYDLIYEAQGKDYADEVRRLRDLLRGLGVDAATLGRRPRMLDVACGTGQHVGRLPDFESVGVDVDPAMLQIAAGRCPDTVLVEGDMRTLDPGGLGAPFDVVTCLFSAIAYMTDLDALSEAIASMARCLGRDGVLLVEPFITPDMVADGRPHAVFADHVDLKVVRMDVPRVRGRRLELEFHYLAADADGVEHRRERHELGIFSVDEIGEAFTAAGLRWTFDSDGISGHGRGLHIGRRRRVT